MARESDDEDKNSNHCHIVFDIGDTKKIIVSSFITLDSTEVYIITTYDSISEGSEWKETNYKWWKIFNCNYPEGERTPFGCY